MPFTINGIGTGLVPASKRKNIDGHTQFDAIEALVVFYLPVVPYKTIHVVSEQGQRYHSVPLRMSGRIATKAFLNRWGNVLGVFGGMFLVIMIWVTSTMARPFTAEDAAILVGSLIAFFVGISFKLIWFVMDRKDRRFKDLIGPHQFGTSDPLHWPDELATAATSGLLQAETAPGLVLAGNRALARGEHARAMVCARLAMRDPRDVEARDLCDRLLAT